MIHTGESKFAKSPVEKVKRIVIDIQLIQSLRYQGLEESEKGKQPHRIGSDNPMDS
jgi:hypothetical protein